MNFQLPVPNEFSFEHCFSFLQRSPKELLHRAGDNSVRKLIRIENRDVLFELSPFDNHALNVSVLNAELSAHDKQQLVTFIAEWFDLGTDLKPFYARAEKDKLLQNLVKQYFGYRIISQPDPF
jgi:DNA-3-methyladenine glycosylase II